MSYEYVTILGYQYYINYDDEYAVFQDAPKMEEYIILPEKVKGVTVKGIGANALYGNQYLKEIHIPDSVYSINADAFSGCVNLKKVVFYASQKPFSRISFYGGVFQDCPALTEILCDKKLPFYSYQGDNFANCSSLVTIDSPILHLSGKDFENCVALKSITLKGDQIKWKTSTFGGCKNLKEIVFLGNIDENIKPSCLNKIKTKKLKCNAVSNVIELAHEGYNVEIISS